MSILKIDEVPNEAVAEGYKLIYHFTLPAEAWIDNYYSPQRKLIKKLRSDYSDIPDALVVFDELEKEREMYMKYSDHYGYALFFFQESILFSIIIMPVVLTSGISLSNKLLFLWIALSVYFS